MTTITVRPARGAAASPAAPIIEAPPATVEPARGAAASPAAPIIEAPPARRSTAGARP